MFDIVTIGSATQDMFVESDRGAVLSAKDMHKKINLLCFDYGAKIDVDRIAFAVGGGAVNTAINFANLGIKTTTIVKTGDDLHKQSLFKELDKYGVDKSFIKIDSSLNTGFSVILTSYEGDRTVLAYRGANSHIKLEDIPFEAIKNSKWLYIAPLAGESNNVLDKIAEFAEENNVSMAINPGTTQIKSSKEKLHGVISTAEVLVMNKDEASTFTGIERDDRTSIENEADKLSPNVSKILKQLKCYNPKVAVVTDGKEGVFAYDGEVIYHAPVFPAKIENTLGAGDAFSSTFVASLIRYDWNIEKSLLIASINAAKVVEHFGAQKGLKNFDELEKILSSSPDYKIRRF